MRPCWVQYLLWLSITLTGTSALLSACGQKGDLYLPENSEAQEEEEK